MFLLMLKTVVLMNIFVETWHIFKILWSLEWSNKQHLFDIELCNIISVFTVTFGKFITAFLNKNI